MTPYDRIGPLHARLRWFLCWIAYRIVLVLPLHFWRWDQFPPTWWLLPYAGEYAYTDGGWPEYRQWRTMGEPWERAEAAE